MDGAPAPTGVVLLDAVNRLRRAETLLRSRAAARLGLRGSEFQTVQYLVARDAEHKPARPKELAELLGVTAPAASMIVDRLIGRGLAIRVADPDDGRGRILYPTDAARSGLADAYGEMPTAVQKLLDAVPEDDARRIAVLAEQIQHIVDTTGV